MASVIDFEADAAPPAPESGELSRVRALAQRFIDQEQFVSMLEEQLADEKEAARRLREEDLPSLMTEIGLSEFKMADGTRITVTRAVECSISEERRPVAHAWLKSHGFGGLIKTEVAVKFDRGEDEIAAAIASSLRETFPNKSIEVEERVHPSTLSAFLREQVENGTPPPAEPFGLRPFNKAKVTLPRAPKPRK
jgi:hypothetical protein